MSEYTDDEEEAAASTLAIWTREEADIEDVVWRLRLRGKSLKAIAKETGLTQTQVQHAIDQRVDPHGIADHRQKLLALELERNEALYQMAFEEAISKRDKNWVATAEAVAARKYKLLGLEETRVVLSRPKQGLADNALSKLSDEESALLEVLLAKMK